MVVICHMHAEEDTTALNGSETIVQVFLIYSKGQQISPMLCIIARQ